MISKLDRRNSKQATTAQGALLHRDYEEPYWTFLLKWKKDLLKEAHIASEKFRHIKTMGEESS